MPDTNKKNPVKAVIDDTTTEPATTEPEEPVVPEGMQLNSSGIAVPIKSAVRIKKTADTATAKVLSKRDKTIARISLIANQHLTSQCQIYDRKSQELVALRVSELFDDQLSEGGSILTDLRPIINS